MNCRGVHELRSSYGADAQADKVLCTAVIDGEFKGLVRRQRSRRGTWQPACCC